ncbi:DUF3916 domain-containing protein [Polynucleobacter sp. AM-26B4]|uniref:DUF3916 domain-containing protein n=1 Tax=Polynucleobacter sp. AM-26B4 TaxID=2689103 RepID=UPI001CAA86BD
MDLSPLRLAQADNKVAAIPLIISLENLFVSDVVLFKSDMSFLSFGYGLMNPIKTVF